MRLVFGHIVGESITHNQMEVLGDSLQRILIVSTLHTLFLHQSEAHWMSDYLLVVQQMLVVWLSKIYRLIELLYNFYQLF